MTPTPAVAGDRDTLGGWPFLDPDQPWPACWCGTRMALFFQLDVPADVGPFGGDHLLAFQCPVHNEACFPPGHPQLPPRYWHEPPAPNEAAVLAVLAAALRGRGRHSRPRPRAALLTVEPTEENDDLLWTFTLGGSPRWSQDPEHYVCSCGSELTFLVQVPSLLGFPKLPDAPEQPDSFSSVEYCLFLGNFSTCWPAPPAATRRRSGP